MKKILFFVIPLILAIIIFSAITFFLGSNSGKGALQVTANPKSNVYLNGKVIGQTPLCKCDLPNMLKAGEYTIRIEPLDTGFSFFEEKIIVTKSVLTVVDRTFGKGVESDGSIITLTPITDKKANELLIISFPDKAQVYVDSNSSGITPLLLNNLTVSDHEIKLVKDGYREKTVRVRAVAGYKLSVVSYLGIDQDQIPQASTSTKSPQQTPTVEQVTPTAEPVAKVIILQTPTGFLRVRASSSISSAEIARVNPGEVYELVNESNGWFEIKLNDGKSGWVSNQYAQKQ